MIVSRRNWEHSTRQQEKSVGTAGSQENKNREERTLRMKPRLRKKTGKGGPRFTSFGRTSNRGNSGHTLRLRGIDLAEMARPPYKGEKREVEKPCQEVGASSSEVGHIRGGEGEGSGQKNSNMQGERYFQRPAKRRKIKQRGESKKKRIHKELWKKVGQPGSTATAGVKGGRRDAARGKKGSMNGGGATDKSTSKWVRRQ